MIKKTFDEKVVTGRRGFFRQLLVQALEGVEQVGRDIVEKRLPQFHSPAPAYTPPSYDNHRFSPQFMIYGPPWPPPLGPYVGIELRKKLDEQFPKDELQSVPRD